MLRLFSMEMTSRRSSSFTQTRKDFWSLCQMPLPSGQSRAMPAQVSRGETGLSNRKSTFIPLMTRDRELLPVHFLTKAERGREEDIMRQWLEVCVTEGGLLLAQQNITRPPLLVAQMTEEWLNYYRKTAQSSNMPFPALGQYQNPSTENCEEGTSGEESEEEEE